MDLPKENGHDCASDLTLFRQLELSHGCRDCERSYLLRRHVSCFFSGIVAQARLQGICAGRPHGKDTEIALGLMRQDGDRAARTTQLIMGLTVRFK